MTQYRAAPVTQRDGSPLASSNCRMASIATGLDHESRGSQLSTGAAMRARQDDQSGGTDSADAAQAWGTYGRTLVIRDGATFEDALADLDAGRLVHLDVWAADCAGPCLSGSGAYGHTIAVAPERSGDRWLVADPWCNPPKWAWWDESLLRAGAESWGGMTYTAATSGPAPLPIDEAVLLARMRLAAKRFMSAFRPDAPATTRPRDTGGSGGRILFTTTNAPAPETEGTDMAIASAANLTSSIRAELDAGVSFYADPNLRELLGELVADADVPFIGSPIGETVAGGSYAVQLVTGTAYSDGSTRPTVVYVAVADAHTYSIPSDGDDQDVRDARDEEWEDALTHGETWPSRRGGGQL